MIRMMVEIIGGRHARRLEEDRIADTPRSRLGLERETAKPLDTLFIIDELSDIPSSVFQPSLLQRPEPE